jgi:hypothetical protein
MTKVQESLTLTALKTLLHLYETPGDFSEDERRWVLQDVRYAIQLEEEEAELEKVREEES